MLARFRDIRWLDEDEKALFCVGIRGYTGGEMETGSKSYPIVQLFKSLQAAGIRFMLVGMSAANQTRHGWKRRVAKPTRRVMQKRATRPPN
jgi:hypothetical protein